MYKFVVLIQGKHYQIETEERIFLFRKQFVFRDVGFYTTRYIQAESANRALEKAFEIINDELKNIVKETERSRLEVRKIQENENDYDLYAPGQGFTFYKEES